MIFSSAANFSPIAADAAQTAIDEMSEGLLAPPAAPMAMPKQVIEQPTGRRLAGWLRLPLPGGRIQGQS